MKITTEHPLYPFSVALVEADAAFDEAAKAAEATEWRSPEHMAACDVMSAALDRYNAAEKAYNDAVALYNKTMRHAVSMRREAAKRN